MKGLSVTGRAVNYLRPYWPLAASAVFVVALSSLFGLLTPWPLKVIIDSVLGDRPLPSALEPALGHLRQDRYLLLILTIVASLGLAVVQRTLDLVNSYLQTKLSSQLQLDLRSALFGQAQKLSLAYHRQHQVGDVLNRISVQAASIGQVALAFLPLAQSVITLVGMFWIAYLLDPQLALLSLVIVPFLYWSIGYYTGRIEPQVRNVRQREADSLSIVSEALSLLPITQAFGREHYEYRRFRTHSEHTLQERLRLTLRQTVFSFAVNLAAAGGTALVIGVGALHVLAGDLTVGLLLVILTYIGSVYTPLQAISAAIGTLQERLVDLQMVFEILDSEPDIRDAPGAVEIPRSQGHLVFQDVSFSYDAREGILTDVSFEIQPGQFAAIVGPTGAGKTTLVSLLPRFHAPSKGRILLDGIDISEIKVKSLRRQFSLVTQEPLLFSGTIEENIRYGHPEATWEELIQSAQAAQVHEFILSLPAGYDSLPGESGVRLSSGERQRITIARAFLRDAPILILDEPTSSLDTRTESAVFKALRQLIAGRTTLMVAHRLSTIRNASVILVMDQGRIVEAGTHKELMQVGGLYGHLVESQMSVRFEPGDQG